MPRKERIEYAGAVYHIISRGNYRKDLFSEGKSGVAFERALFEVVERCEWKLYAYIIMSNHYHLALSTPEPNLVEGMRWLQSTFATRFNRYRGERGHVFQGRYKSILVDEDRPLLGLINYIHLNPVRARICTVSGLKSYKLSSYPKYWKRKPRSGLERRTVMSLMGFADSIGGMRGYQRLLELSEESDPKHRAELYKKYCRGWFIGSAKARRELSKELVEEQLEADWVGADMKELNEAKWERIVKMEMKRLQKDEQACVHDLKGAVWKVKIAKRLRKETTASNPWITKRLCMGHPNRVSNLVHGS